MTQRLRKTLPCFTDGNTWSQMLVLLDTSSPPFVAATWKYVKIVIYRNPKAKQQIWITTSRKFSSKSITSSFIQEVVFKDILKPVTLTGWPVTLVCTALVSLCSVLASFPCIIMWHRYGYQVRLGAFFCISDTYLASFHQDRPHISTKDGIYQ